MIFLLRCISEKKINSRAIYYINKILKRIGAGQAIIIGDKHVLQLDVAVLNHSHRHLVLDLVDLQTRTPSIYYETAIFVQHKNI